MPDREKVISAYECVITRGKSVCECGKCDYYIKDSAVFFCDNQRVLTDVLSMLKDRTKDYEAWAKEIGADTCVNCRHASFNRNDGKSTCPIEHNFALVKDGFCHLFIRMEGR